MPNYFRRTEPIDMTYESRNQNQSQDLRDELFLNMK